MMHPSFFAIKNKKYFHVCSKNLSYVSIYLTQRIYTHIIIHLWQKPRNDIPMHDKRIDIPKKYTSQT